MPDTNSVPYEYRHVVFVDVYVKLQRQWLANVPEKCGEVSTRSQTGYVGWDANYFMVDEILETATSTDSFSIYSTLIQEAEAS